MNERVVVELSIDARGAEAGSAAYVRATQVAQAAYDRFIDRQNAAAAASEANGARMLTASTSTTRLASAYDKLKASLDPAHMATRAMEADLILLDKAATRLGISEAEVGSMLDRLVLKHDANAAAARRQTEEYSRLAAAGREAFALDQSSRAGQSMWNTYAGVRDPSAGSARASAAVFDEAGQAAETMARRVAMLRAELNPLAAAQDRVNAEIAEYVAMAARGEISAMELAQAQAMARGRLATNDNAAGRRSFNGANAAYQMQDVVTMAALGQSPMMTALQQGPQIGMILEQGGGLAAMRTGLASLISPIMLASISFTAVSAAAIQFFTGSRDGAKTLDDRLKEHVKTLKEVEDGYKAIGNVARGSGNPSQLMSGFLSQQAVEVLRQKFSQEAALGTLDPSLLIDREMGGLFSSGEKPNYFVNASDQALGLEKVLLDLMTSIEQGTPNVAKFNDQLAAMGQDPTASDALKKRIEEILLLTKGLGDAQRAIQAYEANFGPGGLLRGASEYQRRDIKNLDDFRVQQQSILRQQTRDLDAQRTGIGARSPAELEQAARAREAAMFRDESSAVRHGRIDNAGELARLQAEQALADAYAERTRALESTLSSQKLDLDLIGKTAGEQAGLRMEFERTQAVRDEAARNNIVADQKEIDAIKQKSAEFGRMADAIAKAKLENDLRFEHNQLLRAPDEQVIAAQLRGAGRPVDLKGEEAGLIRINLELEHQRGLWEDIRGTGASAIDSIFDSAAHGFDNFEEMGTQIPEDLTKQLIQVGLANPFKNAAYGTNLPTIDDIGGLGGFFATLLGGGLPGAGDQTVGSMNVNAASVVINGGEFGGAVSRLLGGTQANDNGASFGSRTGLMDMLGGSSDKELDRSLLGSTAAMPVGGDIAAYIRQAALARGIDPDIALRVARSEGGLKDPFRQGESLINYGTKANPLMLREESYGPFQLHMRNGGVGARALAAGIDPRTNWRGGIDYGLDEAANKGWGQWFGAAKAGIGNREGLEGAHAIGQLSEAATKAAGGLTQLDTGVTGAVKALTGNLGNINFGGNGGMGIGGGGGMGAGTGGGFFDWLRSLFGFADGTSYAPPGMAWVGERGPEIVKFRGGEQVIPNHALGGRGGGNPPKIVFQNTGTPQRLVEEREEQDDDGGRKIVYVLADQVVGAMNKKGTSLNRAMRERGAEPPRKRR